MSDFKQTVSSKIRDAKPRVRETIDEISGEIHDIANDIYDRGSNWLDEGNNRSIALVAIAAAAGALGFALGRGLRSRDKSGF